MSRWLGALAGNVESLLDKVDQVAGHALQKDASSIEHGGDQSEARISQWQPPTTIMSSSTTYTPFLSSSVRKMSPTPEKPYSRSEESRSSPSDVLKSVDRVLKAGVNTYFITL